VSVSLSNMVNILKCKLLNFYYCSKKCLFTHACAREYETRIAVRSLQIIIFGKVFFITLQSGVEIEDCVTVYPNWSEQYKFWEELKSLKKLPLCIILVEN
jgi:hypothetical protein